MIIKITPCPKPRQTQRDKWKPSAPVLRYRAFADELRLKARGVELDGANILFLIPMPKSWSKKQRKEMLGEPHRQKPDLDNLLKSLADALYGDDSHIATLTGLSKRWSDVGAILINH